MNGSTETKLIGLFKPRTPYIHRAYTKNLTNSDLPTYFIFSILFRLVFITVRVKSGHATGRNSRQRLAFNLQRSLVAVEMETLNRLADAYHDLMDNKSDQRVKDWPLMSSPFYTLAICLTYAFTVKVSTYSRKHIPFVLIKGPAGR